MGTLNNTRKNIEESVLSIISKIKKDRNRTCLQNIHTFMNRRNMNIEVENATGNTKSNYKQYYCGQREGR